MADFTTAAFGKIMEEIAPLSLMESWDNSGFQIDLGGKTDKILVALEPTMEVVDEAISMGAGLILTHHPMFFSDVNRIMSTEPKGAMAIKLIQNNISIYSSHTPFDIAEKGNNHYLGELLGFENPEMMSEENPYCRQGVYEKPISPREIATRFCEKTGLPMSSPRLVGEVDKPVTKIAWCTGSGSDFIEEAAGLGIQCFITGDLKYHTAVDSKALGISLIDLGHFGTEVIFAERATSLLENKIKDKGFDAVVVKSRVMADPFCTLV